MGRYLDHLNEEFDDITRGVTEILERAADDNRETTSDEQADIARSDTRRDELTKAIEYHTALEERSGKVASMRARVSTLPVQRSVREPSEPEYDIAREFPSPAHYAVTVHRALVLRDPDAIAAIERATAHQTTADNPGLIPRPILGPLVELLMTSRPFIQSITNRPLPTGKFDRPTITQHVAVAKQAAEKDETASQKLIIGNLPVSASTYAGHLNISRQDIKWTTPAILQIVFDDFAAMYARVTDADAVAQFVASVVATAALDSADFGGLMSALYGIAGGMYATSGVLPDTLWAAPDVWGTLGSLLTQPNGGAAFPSISLTSTAGNPMGLRLVVDPNFAAGTAIIGASRYAEWFEDVDGLLQVQEPDVLGQLVGYAGFGAFLNTAPDAFSKVTGIVTPLAAGGGGSETTSSTRR